MVLVGAYDGVQARGEAFITRHGFDEHRSRRAICVDVRAVGFLDLPAVLQRAHIQRERQGVGRWQLPHRRERHEIRVECRDVLLSHAREVIEREDREKMRAIASNPLMQGTREGLFGPVPDTRRRIRSDVGGINRAKWRRDSESASEGLALPGCVAARAVSRSRQDLAKRHLFGRKR